MSEKELLYLGLLNDICNTKYTEEDLPAGFELAISKCISEESNLGYSSKTVQDLSVVFDKSDVKGLTYPYIYPYMKQRW